MQKEQANQNQQVRTDYKIYLNTYQVYSDGTIYSQKSKRLLKPATSGSNGYYHYQLGGKKVYPHRLVAELFIGNPEGLPQINHKNGIKTDNRVENLEFCTAGDNVKHMYATGLKTTKLTREDIIQIRTKEMDVPQRKLAQKYGVSQTMIGYIKNRKLWIHV